MRLALFFIGAIFWSFSPAEADERLQDDSRPLLQLFGKRGELTHDWALNKADAGKHAEQFSRIRKEGRKASRRSTKRGGKTHPN